MKYYILISIAFLTLAVISSCASNKKHVNTKKQEIRKTDLKGLNDIWGLKAIQGKAIETKRGIILEINTHEMSMMGNAHCNNFNGVLKSDNNQEVMFKSIVSTQMACSGLQYEQLYLGLLETVRSYQIKSLHLLLFNEAGELVLDFIKID